MKESNSATHSTHQKDALRLRESTFDAHAPVLSYVKISFNLRKTQDGEGSKAIFLFVGELTHESSALHTRLGCKGYVGGSYRCVNRWQRPQHFNIAAYTLLLLNTSTPFYFLKGHCCTVKTAVCPSKWLNQRSYPSDARLVASKCCTMRIHPFKIEMPSVNSLYNQCGRGRVFRPRRAPEGKSASTHMVPLALQRIVIPLVSILKPI